MATYEGKRNSIINIPLGGGEPEQFTVLPLPAPL